MKLMAQMEAQTKGESSPLERGIETLEGVRASRAKEFAARGVATLGDLLEYFPRNYQQERSERPISQLVADQIQIARGEVVAADYIAVRPRPRFEATLSDGSGKLALVWFNSSYLRKTIYPGKLLRVRGRVKLYRNIPSMAQPRWQEVEADAEPVGQDVFRGVYPASAKLSSAMIWQTIDRALPELLPAVEEWFEDALLKRRRLMARREALWAIHQPKGWKEAADARRRLVYDELMLMQLGLALSAKLRQGRLTAPKMRLDRLLDERIRKRFPFELTGAQQKAVWEIAADIQSSKPMSRLLQGDVGSGKTVVALYAMLVAVANRLQAAILAPTEVLAEQHYLTLSNLLRDSNVTIELLTSRTKRESRGAVARQVAAGKVHIAVGTQALIQEDVEFANLGLVVADEQHKLGVRQRATLKGKGLSPHYLVMTATPIPRTLALSYFADFDVSTIDELPPGRRPIRTRWLRQSEAEEAYRFVREQVKQGRQAYIVLAQIEDNGVDDVKSVKAHFEKLSKGPLGGLKLGMLHGQMKTEEKQTVMTEFRAGRVDVLVATTVIEVGVDVVNATVMVIEDADRFGLSQLHQIRGRVGRGTADSYCLLVADAPVEEAESRLNAMTRTNDGFEISEIDLKLRGPGDFFGTRQHGLPQFKLADITQELELLKTAKDDAMELLRNDPDLSRPEHRALRQRLGRQFGDSLFLAQVG
ncbi:MAG TPA: ATP-dependent DNA helicase RecG [Tepidisphaeraceae bacterium]|jgi:ATP-dependent DNA helicase RecG|nr:ATP-dependent DNA helicase RecG [Tepidisphaeraceae bacterium]